MFTNEIYYRWMKKNQTDKYREIEYHLPVFQGRVLDVGIGPGWFEEFFKLRAVGIDIDKKSAADIIASGNEIPLKNKSFDNVICLNTIHLIGGNEIKRVLKKGGLLLLSHHTNKENEKDVEKKLLNMFKEFKLLEKIIVGNKEKDLVLLLEKNKNPRVSQGPVV